CACSISLGISSLRIIFSSSESNTSGEVAGFIKARLGFNRLKSQIANPINPIIKIYFRNSIALKNQFPGCISPTKPSQKDRHKLLNQDLKDCHQFSGFSFSA